MSKIKNTFQILADRNESALIPFLTLGYPSLAESSELILAMAEGGADLIELGIAFSDPIADGPTIQECSQIALANGITLRKSLEMIAELRQKGLKIPLILMGYCNPFLAYGLAELAKDAAAAGVDAFIVPDLPPAEAKPWKEAFASYNLDLIFFIGPTTSEDRIVKIAKEASGFLYCLSLTGVTGSRENLPNDLRAFLAKIRRKTSLPLAVGFGLSKPSHIREVSEHADGAIVASALLKGLKEQKPAMRKAFVKNFVAELKAATHRH